MQKLRDVLDTVSRGRRQSALQSLVEALEESHNVGVSVKLRQQLTLDDASDSDESMTGGLLVKNMKKKYSRRAEHYERMNTQITITYFLA